MALRKPIHVESAAQQSKWIFRAALCALALAAYANSFGLGFAMDGERLLRDQRIQTASAESLKLIAQHHYWWPEAADRLYRPVTTASLLFNYAALGNGTDPAGYHWINFLLHLANVALVFALALKLFEREWPAFFAAALWAVHPIATEAVTNVAGRADLLAAMATLGALLLYTRLLDWNGANLGLGAAALFVIATLGVFSKENAAVLLALMLLWDLTFSGRGWRLALPQRAAAYAAAGAAVLLMVWARHIVFAAMPEPEPPFLDNPIGAAGFWAGRFTAIRVIGLDLFLLVWPVPLAADRTFHQVPIAGTGDVFAWAALAIVIAILSVGIARRRRDPLIFWCVGFFAIALLPTSNVVVTIGSAMAERFLYLPSVGFAIAVAALAYRLKSPRNAPVILGIAIALCAARTLARNPEWNDNLTLASSDVHSAPGSTRLHAMVAEGLYARDGVGSLDRAIEESEKAWEILRAAPPGRSYALTPANLGLFYMAKADAVGDATPAARIWNDKAIAVLLAAREISQAVESAFDADQAAHGKPLALRHASYVVYRNLGKALTRGARYAEAVEAYRYGIDLAPSAPEMYDRLAAVYRALGDRRREALTIEEKVAATGDAGQAVAVLKAYYGPQSCAVSGERLSLSCPEVHDDMCVAMANAAKHFDAARKPAELAALRESAARYGCPAW